MNKKQVATGGGLGLSLSVVLTWLWNSYMPENQMPAEVSAAVGSILTLGLAAIFK